MRSGASPRAYNNKIRVVGPGGWGCFCCAPGKTKDRRALRKKADKRSMRILDRFIHDGEGIDYEAT